MVKASRILLLGAIFTVPMVSLRAGPFTISDFLFFTSAIVVALSTARPPARAPLLLVIACALTIAAGLLTAYNSADPNAGYLVVLRLVYIFGVLPWQACAVLNSRAHLARAIWALLLGVALSCLAAVIQGATGMLLTAPSLANGRIPGLGNHVNGFGGTLALATPMAFAIMSLTKRKWAVVTVLILYGAGLILSGSVTGMSSAMAGVIFVLIQQRRFVKGTILIGALVLAAYRLGIWLQSWIPGARDPLTRLDESRGLGSGPSTLELRLITMRHAWSQISDHPFNGVGLDDTSGGTFDGVTLTHNILLRAWFQGGPLLLTALILAAVAMLAPAFRTQSPNVTYRSAIMAGIVGVSVFSMTGPVLYERWFWIPFILALASAPVAHRAGRRRGLTPRGRHTGLVRSNKDAT